MSGEVADRAAGTTPFFILGAGRSGTSLLSRMLNRHPNLAVPPESHLFATFCPWLKYYGDLSIAKNRTRLVTDALATGPLQDWVPRLSRDEVLSRSRGDDFGGVFDAVMRAWAAKQGKQRWGEKTPKNAYYWHEIERYFGNAKVVYVVRDGRDVAMSMIQARFGPKTVYAAARSWADYCQTVERIRAALAADRFHLVHYRDVLDDPGGTLRQVCDFLGEDYADEMLQFHEDNTPYPTDERNRANLRMPLITTNKEKWRTGMSRDELRIFESVAGDTLRHYGYRPALDRATMSSAEQLVRRYVEAPYRRSLARLKDRKGQKERLVQLALLSRRVAMRPFVG